MSFRNFAKNVFRGSNRVVEQVYLMLEISTDIFISQSRPLLFRLPIITLIILLIYAHRNLMLKMQNLNLATKC